MLHTIIQMDTRLIKIDKRLKRFENNTINVMFFRQSDNNYKAKRFQLSFAGAGTLFRVLFSSDWVRGFLLVRE